MESPGSGFLGRLSEKVVGWIALGLLLLLGYAIWQMGPERRAAILEGIGRTLGWLLIAGVLPWSARLILGRILTVGSNWAGVALLAAYFIVDVVAGAVLLGGLPTGGWGWVAALAALAVAGTYNYLVTEYLAEQAGG
jgi:hypothetical protein